MDAKAVRKELIRLRPHAKPSLKEVIIVMEGFQSNNWENAHQTKLYRKDGTAYCQLLEVLANNKSLLLKKEN